MRLSDWCPCFDRRDERREGEKTETEREPLTALQRFGATGVLDDILCKDISLFLANAEILTLAQVSLHLSYLARRLPFPFVHLPVWKDQDCKPSLIRERLEAFAQAVRKWPLLKLPKVGNWWFSVCETAASPVSLSLFVVHRRHNFALRVSAGCNGWFEIHKQLCPEEMEREGSTSAVRVMKVWSYSVGRRCDDYAIPSENNQVCVTEIPHPTFPSNGIETSPLTDASTSNSSERERESVSRGPNWRITIYGESTEEEGEEEEGGTSGGQSLEIETCVPRKERVILEASSPTVRFVNFQGVCSVVWDGSRFLNPPDRVLQNQRRERENGWAGFPQAGGERLVPAA
uniref:Uncharacterized protein n=1 Tax=Chromera velia CCMP2878 TaxID=1169474 RepID=A0A0G4FKD7_9ALVE|mmetsp:Transcript_20927/g.41751  ORF Transcript_20927/g.41751 Transcript_20927/m.41751 type:complete len:345 (-) Transcript_20927:1407-2441(-)|eukprot:Cvel_3458.t1-p1 / transcript=Cvel_3458.t1 / gene=Cvel_3458 / organism=Chromera_velia_CCMP2878 / gene_product=hypothetical protein / transcript_product=hypothetical protein / location=Cvel_scaffold139:76617-77648(-) / protein_length=344 / sequence_SO=supercontig / SO=protein_coding / is_pseudo=false